MSKKLDIEIELSPIEKIDKTIHSPARLKILAILAAIEKADFTFLGNQSGLSRGNLSSHLGVLEEAGYIEIEKVFVEKIPRTLINISKAGKNAMQEYRQTMNQVLEELIVEKKG